MTRTLVLDSTRGRTGIDVPALSARQWVADLRHAVEVLPAMTYLHGLRSVKQVLTTEGPNEPRRHIADIEGAMPRVESTFGRRIRSNETFLVCASMTSRPFPIGRDYEEQWRNAPRESLGQATEVSAVIKSQHILLSRDKEFLRLIATWESRVTWHPRARYPQRFWYETTSVEILLLDDQLLEDTFSSPEHEQLPSIMLQQMMNALEGSVAAAKYRLQSMESRKEAFARHIARLTNP